MVPELPNVYVVGDSSDDTEAMLMTTLEQLFRFHSNDIKSACAGVSRNDIDLRCDPRHAACTKLVESNMCSCGRRQVAPSICPHDGVEVESILCDGYDAQ